MIFKDLLSPLDSESKPGNRIGEFCLNCGEGYFFHKGWACDVAAQNTNFSALKPSHRYETFSMISSIFIETEQVKYDSNQSAAVTNTTNKYTISDWQAWAHNVPGDCACGIKKHLCDYHK